MINSYLSVKTKVQTIVITEKSALKRSKKNWLRQGLNQHAAELVNHCLSTWFCKECTTAVNNTCYLSSLYTSAFSALYKSQLQILLYNHNIQALRWRAFNFAALVSSRNVLGIANNSDFKLSKKTCFKKFVRKKSFGPTGIRILYVMLESQLLYQLTYKILLWF